MFLDRDMIWESGSLYAYTPYNNKQDRLSKIKCLDFGEHLGMKESKLTAQIKQHFEYRVVIGFKHGIF